MANIITDLELRRLRMVMVGMTETQVGKCEGVAKSTVHRTLQRVAKRLGAQNRRELYEFAQREGLL